MTTIMICVWSFLLSFVAVLLPQPEALGASIFSLMFWVIAWIIEWGKRRYARIRRQYN